MIDRRRWPRPTLSRRYRPPASGPRWRSTSVIFPRTVSSTAAPGASTIPQIPHTSASPPVRRGDPATASAVALDRLDERPAGAEVRLGQPPEARGQALAGQRRGALDALLVHHLESCLLHQPHVGRVRLAV